jgi:hypothetical protein
MTNEIGRVELGDSNSVQQGVKSKPYGGSEMSVTMPAFCFQYQSLRYK